MSLAFTGINTSVSTSPFTYFYILPQGACYVNASGRRTVNLRNIFLGLTTWDPSTVTATIADNRNKTLAINPFQLQFCVIRGDTDSNAITCVDLAQINPNKIIHQACKKKVEENIFETL